MIIYDGSAHNYSHHECGLGKLKIIVVGALTIWNALSLDRGDTSLSNHRNSSWPFNYYDVGKIYKTKNQLLY